MRVALRLYIGTVLVVFAALMAALLNDGQETAPSFTVDDTDVIAIVEEYQQGRISRVSVSLDEIDEYVPTPAEPAWQSHAVPAVATTKPRIAVIIDDLGLDESATNRLAAMPGPYTLSYLPYADNLRNQTRSVRASGHELMVHLPMQSHRASADPGDNALLTGLSFDEFGRRLEWNLNRFDGYVGINNHMGSRLTEDPALMVRVMARLRRGGFLYVDSLTTPNSMGKRAALATSVPFLARDIFLDNERDMGAIRRQLDATERIARLRGYAIAIGHPYPVTLEALSDWQKSLDFKGLELVPVSQIMSEDILPESIASR